MRIVPRTLRMRLTVWYGFALAFVLAAFGFTVYGVVRHRMLTHHDEPLRQMAAAVIHILNEQPDCHDLAPDQVRVLDQMGRLILVHEVEEGHQVFYQSPEMRATSLAPAVGALGWQDVRDPGVTTLERNGLPWRVLSVPYQSRAGRHGIVRLMENLGDIEATLASLRNALLLLAPAGVLVSVLGAYALSGRALAPVDRVTRQAMEIEASRLDQRLPHPGVDDELGRLVDTLNRMIARLQTSFEAMTRFTADASHELRTPLATLRNTVEVALDRPRDVAELRAALVSAGEEAGRLEGIVGDLLVLARADAGRVPFRMERLDLAALARSLGDPFGASARERGLALTVRAPEPAWVLGDERWLCRLVGNLLDNAMDFTPSGGTVAVEVAGTDSGVRLAVLDTGSGIPPEGLDRVFERFFQAEPARPRHGGAGSGLGLAIAAWIAGAHGGTIGASNLPGGGARLEVHLPGGVI